MASPPSGDMLFSDFCLFLNKVRGKGFEGQLDKKHLLSGFFRKIKNACENDEDFQSKSKEIISILLSDSNEARKLDMGEKKLTDLVCKVAQIKGLSSKKIQGQGMVAMILADEVHSRGLGGETSNMTVKDVCQKLDAMALGNSMQKQNVVEDLIQNVSKDELIWIFNTIMRNTESFLGVTRKLITESISPEASEVWKNTRDLDRLTSRPADTTDPDYFLGVNFCPQLLARLSLETIDEQVALNLKGGFFMELKYDGEHVLMHKKGTNYKWFTRNGKDFTEHYGENNKEKLAKQIHPVFKSSVEECILDCELMHYDEKRGCLVRHMGKAADGTQLSYKSPQAGHRIVVVVFDMLYFGGKVHGQEFKEDLMRVPLSDRVQIMNDRLLKKNEHYNIFIPDRSEGTTGEEIREFYQQATQAGEEGIAIKRKDSLYFIGERAKRNGWFKLKEMFDMDLVVVGYMPAKDSRGSAFLLAAWDDGNKEGQDLHVICKAYSGLKNIEREQILDDARSEGKLLKEPPDCLTGWKGDPNYVYFRPANFVVVEAKAYGIRNGSLIDVVIRRIRTDKSICKEDIDDYRTIRRHQPGQNDIRPDEDEPSTSTDQFKSKRITKKSIFEAPSTSQISPKRLKTNSSQRLKNKIVCLMPSFDKKLRTQCHEILEKHGAKVVATPTANTDFIVAPAENHMRVKTAIKKNTHTILKGEWLLRCEAEGKIITWKPSEIVLEVPGAFVIEED